MTIPLPDSLGAFAGNSCQVWDSADNKLFVGGDGGVLVIDASANERLAIVPIEGRVRALCCSPVGHKIYCATDSGEIAVLSGVTNQLIATLPVSGWPYVLCYNSRDNKVYSAREADSSIAVIDCEADTIVAIVSGLPHPDQLCYASVPDKVYCVSHGGGMHMIAVIDGAGDSVVAQLPTSMTVLGLAYDPQDDKIYAAGYADDTVAVIDGATDSVTALIHIDNVPFALCYDSRDNKMYCANWYGMWFLTSIDCAADTVIAAIPAGPPWGSEGLCYNSRGNKLYCQKQASDPPVVEVVDCGADSLLGVVIADCDNVCYNSASDFVYCTDYYGMVTIVDGATENVVGAVASRDLPYALCYAPQHSKVYCACYNSRAVVVVDAATNALLARVPTGLGARNLCYNPTGDKVYCVNEVSEALTVIDAVADTVVATIEDAATCDPLCYNSHDNKVYCAGPGLNTYVIDGASDSIVTSIPVVGDLLYSPRHNKVYCAAYPYDSVAVIDGSTDSIVATIDLDGVGMMCCDSVTGNLYCSRSSDSCVGVIDGEGDTLLTSIVVGGSTGWLCYDSRDNRVYCTFSRFSGGDSLAAIDCATHEIVARLRLPHGPVGMRYLCYGPENNRVYYTNQSDVVTVIDAASSTIVAGVNVGMHPGAMVWTPLQGRLYVANRGSYISVIRDSGGGIEETMDDERGTMNAAPTVIRGVLNLEVGSRQQSADRAELLDVSGRMVMDLKSGANDVRALAPGIYFVRQASGVERGASSVSKVVVTR